MRDSLESEALKFATEAHFSIGQMRKYTNEPYIVHPIAVAEIVRSVEHTPEMIAAALLHDTVEDTPVMSQEIHREFGPIVGSLVDWLTDVSRPSDGNRTIRKKIDLEYIAKIPPEAKTIKLADIIDNTKSIIQFDPNFWKTYRQEKINLLQVLKDGNQKLWDVANEQMKVCRRTYNVCSRGTIWWSLA